MRQSILIALTAAMWIVPPGRARADEALPYDHQNVYYCESRNCRGPLSTPYPGPQLKPLTIDASFTRGTCLILNNDGGEVYDLILEESNLVLYRGPIENIQFLVDLYASAESGRVCRSF